MSISTLLIRRSSPVLVFYLAASAARHLRWTKFFKLCHRCFKMCVLRLLLSSSQLYLNESRAKQKNDFPSRGQ
jgi:hypothetical protein